MNKKNKEKGHFIIKNIIMACCALLVAVFILFALLKVITRHGQELEVPSFMNMTMAEAENLARKNNFRLEVTDSVYINRMSPGVIFKQNPAEGSKVKKNRRILLTINATQPKKVQMPSLVGFSLRQAQSELIANQLNVGRLIYVEDIATNNVLDQLYNGRSIAPGKEIPAESSIDLRLGLNSEESTTLVPNLSGIKYHNVKSVLVENSLNLGKAIFDETVTTYADSLEAKVYRQIPRSSDFIGVPMGTSVTIYLSTDNAVIEKEIALERKRAEEEKEAAMESETDL